MVELRCRECRETFTGDFCQEAADKLVKHDAEKHRRAAEGVWVFPGQQAPTADLRKRAAEIIREKATGEDADLKAIADYLER